MTRKERLDWLCRLRSGLVWFDVPPKERPVFEQVLSEVIKALEQEPILDKIRAEIEQITDTMGVSYNQYVSKIDVLQIIDKYTEENTSNCNSCEHKNEVDGSNCYECVKGIRNNYTAESEE